MSFLLLEIAADEYVDKTEKQTEGGCQRAWSVKGRMFWPTLHSWIMTQLDLIHIGTLFSWDGIERRAGNFYPRFLFSILLLTRADQPGVLLSTPQALNQGKRTMESQHTLPCSSVRFFSDIYKWLWIRQCDECSCIFLWLCHKPLIVYQFISSTKAIPGLL